MSVSQQKSSAQHNDNIIWKLNNFTFLFQLLYMYGFEGEEFKKSNFGYLFAHLAFLHAAAFVSIAARGRWFDSELPSQHFNKSATICVTQPPLAC